MSIDGYIAGLNGEMDWMVWNWDDKLKNYVFELMEPVNIIILGRKMTDGFVSYWSDVMTKPDDPSSIDRSHVFAKKSLVFFQMFWKCLRGRASQIRLFNLSSCSDIKLSGMKRAGYNVSVQDPARKSSITSLSQIDFPYVTRLTFKRLPNYPNKRLQVSFVFEYFQILGEAL